MKTEASLLQAITNATTLREQAGLVAELDALRAAQASRLQDDRDLDFANAVVRETLTPVLAHSLHTASTDWLSEAEMPTADSNVVHAEASLWFGKKASLLSEDTEEFTEQARGYAHRYASQFGEQREEAERAFLDYVAFLQRREGASGLDQVQQLIDPNNKPKKTNLPTDVFDNFAPEVADMNQGIDEAQSTEGAPLLNEILQKGQGEGQPEVGYQHGEYIQQVNQPVFPMPSAGGKTSSVLDDPSVALGYVTNLDEFRAAMQTQAAREASDDEESSLSSGTEHTAAQSLEESGKNDEPDEDPGDNRMQTPCLHVRARTRRGVTQYDVDHVHDAMSLATVESHNNLRDAMGHAMLLAHQHGIDNIYHPGGHIGLTAFEQPHHTASKKEAASGLDQVQQLTNVHDELDPRPLNEQVAFPLLPFMQQQYTTAPDGDNPKPKTEASVSKQADMWGNTEGVEAQPETPKSNNPLMNHTMVGEDKAVEEPSNAMAKAVTHKDAALAEQEFNKGFQFAASWQPGDRLVTQGSAEFEAGLYAGISENKPAQQAWLDAHVAQAHLDPFIANRPQLHLEFTALKRQAGTTTDLETMDSNLDVTNDRGETPIQGRGEVPPLAGRADAAAPAGAAPYNGAEPFGVPVAPDPGWMDPRKRQAAFRAAVAQNLNKEQ